MGSCRGSLWEMGYGFLDEDHGYYRISDPIVGDGSQAESFLKQMISFDAGGGIRTRDFGDAPSDQHHEDYEPRTLTRLSYPGTDTLS